jgi:type I restriction enzyme S subunit
MREAGSGARFENGDTLVARITPCLENGKTAFVDFLAEGEVAWGSTEYVVLRPLAPMPDLFAYLLARSDGFRSHAIQNMSGTSGRQRVPAEAMGRYQIAVPPPAVLESFGGAVQPLFRLSSALSGESRKLTVLRDYLLPKLLSGQVPVEVGRA